MTNRNAWRRRREATGLSLSELARRSGLNKATIHYIENGIPATPEQAAAIVRVLAAVETAAGGPTAPDV